MEIGSSVSRRTRSRTDAYYCNRLGHDAFKRKRVFEDNDDNDNEDEDLNLEKKKKNKVVVKSVLHEVKKKKKKSRVIEKHDFDNEFEDLIEKEKDLKKSRVIEKHDFDKEFEDLIKTEKDLIREDNPICVENHEHDYDYSKKFSLDDEISNLPEKSEWVKEIDYLFDQLEMGLWESHETGDVPSPIIKDEYDCPKARCDRGEHDNYLDEQIGIVCKYCSSVLLDIKHVMPSFCSERKYEWKGMHESKTINMDRFDHGLDSMDYCGMNSESGRGRVFDLIPKSNHKLYPHQLEGFEFLWKNIAGDVRLKSLERLPSNGGRGCIISHAPGTGKTRLTIVFLQTFMKLYPHCRPVIIAPCGMLLTWEQELKKWDVGIRFNNLNESKLSDHEHEALADNAAASGESKKSRDFIRFIKLVSWMKGGSVLGVGYRLFEELAGEGEGAGKNREKFKKVLLESPGLVVMDEGHTPRNDQSLMWKALTKVRTQRRVILSGTPFQNNFTELYNTLCLVNPSFCDQIMSERPRSRPGRRWRKGRDKGGRDEWGILTNSINKKSTSNDDGLKKLCIMIKPFVHIHKGSILEKTLPGMKDCLIILKPSDVQMKLLHKIPEIDNFLEQSHLASLISIHPSLVSKRPEFSHLKSQLKSLKSDPYAGVKTSFLIKLVRLATRLNEKVLIFGEFIPPLLHIKSLLKSNFKWNEGREIMYMDGEINLKKRQRLIGSFNDKTGHARVMLASQRACSEGISLVGASRVVLLDVLWNPAVERQAICRAYRIGQERKVYVYHLVTWMEVKKYERQVEKERISKMLFSSGGGGGEVSGDNDAVRSDEVLEAMVRQEGEGNGSMFEKIVHQPKASHDLLAIG